MKRGIPLCTLFFILSFAVPAQGWAGKKDNKSIAELDLMNEFELCLESLFVCSHSAIRRNANPGIAVDGSEYLSTIGRVTRKNFKNEQPEWLRGMHSGIANADSDACDIHLCFPLAPRNEEQKPKVKKKK